MLCLCLSSMLTAAPLLLLLVFVLLLVPAMPCACVAAVWLLHEQTAIALLELGNPSGALPLVKAVLVHFDKDSIRARRLQVC